MRSSIWAGNVHLQPRKPTVSWAASRQAWPVGQRRWFCLFTLLLWDPTWSTASISGAPNTGRPWICWSGSKGSLVGHTYRDFNSLMSRWRAYPNHQKWIANIQPPKVFVKCELHSEACYPFSLKICYIIMSLIKIYSSCWITLGFILLFSDFQYRLTLAEIPIHHLQWKAKL